MAARIPDEQKPAIKALLALDATALAEIAKRLNAAAAGGSAEGFADRVDFSEVPGAPPTDDVVAILVSLYTTYDKSKQSIDGFLKRVRPAIENLAGDAAATEGAVDQIVDLLRQALAMDETLGTIAKRFTIWYEHPNTFCDSRIISDLRPIFAHDLDREPHAFLISHDLRITTHTGRDYTTEDVHVVCAKEDLLRLQQQIERALQKDQTLEGVISKAGGVAVNARRAHETKPGGDHAGGD